MNYLAVLLICITPIGQGIRGISNLTDYMGCYNSEFFAQKSTRLGSNNSRITCKMFCQFQYRYAGTNDGTDCLCRNNISITTAKEEECDESCPMHKNETCGGKKGVQVYDTWPCRNEARCNGSKCVDIDETEYKCQCEPGWTGKHCTEILTPEPPSTRTNIFTTITPIIFISSTIVGQDTESKTTFEQTSLSDINSEVATLKDKKWLTIGIPVAAVMFVMNGIFLTVWCIRRRTANQDTESDSDEISTVHTISHNQSCLELEKIHTSREEIIDAVIAEDNVYDCIDDSVLYETIDK